MTARAGGSPTRSSEQDLPSRRRRRRSPGPVSRPVHQNPILAIRTSIEEVEVLARLGRSVSGAAAEGSGMAPAQRHSRARAHPPADGQGSADGILGAEQSGHPHQPLPSCHSHHRVRRRARRDLFTHDGALNGERFAVVPPSWVSSRVEPSMSLNIKVSVPERRGCSISSV